VALHNQLEPARLAIFPGGDGVDEEIAERGLH
jgi:hypothetical protein